MVPSCTAVAQVKLPRKTVRESVLDVWHAHRVVCYNIKSYIVMKLSGGTIHSFHDRARARVTSRLAALSPTYHPKMLIWARYSDTAAAVNHSHAKGAY